MDIGDIDPEDFQHEWRLARREWDQINQRKLEAQVAGVLLAEAEQAAWLQAKSRFEACERLWDQMYKAGVVVVVGDDGDDDLA
jgi:hypothetical protein